MQMKKLDREEIKRRILGARMYAPLEEMQLRLDNLIDEYEADIARYYIALCCVINDWDVDEYSSIERIEQIEARAERRIKEAEFKSHTYCQACHVYGGCYDWCDDEYKSWVKENRIV